jgi:peptidoglycan hydrolase-like protein with peptidoglycan-binding domain
MMDIQSWVLPISTGSNATGVPVEELQAFLKLLDPTFQADRDATGAYAYGSNTAAAVKAFQSAHFLPVTGDIDWPTAALLHLDQDWRQNLPDYGFDQVLYVHTNPMMGAAFKAFWNLMSTWPGAPQPDHLPGGAMYYGPLIAEGVRKFKASQGLQNDGVCSYPAVRALLRETRPLNDATHTSFTVRGRVTLDGAGFGGRHVHLSTGGAVGYPLGHGVTAGNGDYTIGFSLPAPAGTAPGKLPSNLKLHFGDGAFPQSLLLDAPSAPGPVVINNANIALTAYTLVGTAVSNVDSGVVVPGRWAMAFVVGLDAQQIRQITPIGTAAQTAVDGGFTLTFSAVAAPDVLVRIYDRDPVADPAAKVLSESAVLFNLGPAESPLRIPVSALPPDALQPVPAGSSKFDELVGQMTAGGYAPVATVAKLKALPQVQRKETIAFIAGDLFVSENNLHRPQNGETNFETNLLRYEAEADRLVRTRSITVERVLRAFALVDEATAWHAEVMGFAVELQFAENKPLVLILDDTGASSLPAAVWFSLLPETSLALSDAQALRMVAAKTALECRQLLINAVASGAVSLTATEIEDALVALAEFSLAIKGDPVAIDDLMPGWKISTAALSAADRSVLAQWLASEERSATRWRQLQNSAGGRDLEWQALTFGLANVATALKSLSPTPVDVRDLAGFDDYTLRSTILPHADAGIPKACETWPRRVRDQDAKKAAGKFVEWIRTFVPSAAAATAELEDLAAACLEIDDVIASLRGLTASGPTRPVRTREDLRDCDRADLRAKILTVAQNGSAYENWPDKVRRGTPDESTDALLARLRPEDARQALRLFLDLHPYFLFDISADDLETLIGPSGAPKPFLLRLCNDPDVAQAIAHDCGVHLHTLRLLWSLTRRDHLRPGLRTQAVEWLVTNGATTKVDVMNASIGSAPETLKPALQRAREEAGWIPPVTKPPEEQFVPVNGDDQLVDCECEEWCSPSSAAAYLADLMKFLDETKQAGEFEQRRPDIKGLAITRNNSATLVPEIDLGIELLEDLAAAPRPRSTHNTSSSDEAALRLSPEHSTPHDDTPCYDELKKVKSPIPLPYDQQLDIVRSYLQAFGTTRHRAMLAARKDIAHHTSAWELREPENEPLAWERLGLSPEEAAIFALVTDSAGSLDDYFGFPESTADTDIIKHLSHLPGFLERTALDLEEARALLDNLPAWLPIATAPSPAKWGCDLPAVSVQGLDATVLHRLHRYLRLRRCLQQHFADRPALGEAFGRLRDVANVLALYLPDGGGWKLNNTFLWELATLIKLACTAPICWFWWKDGLAFAKATAQGQQTVLAGLIDLKHTPGGDLVATTSEDNWTTLQKLCAIDLTGQTTEANRDPIRRAARLVEIANKIPPNPQLSVPQLHYLFWEQGFVAGPPPKDQCPHAKPDAAFNALSEEFGRVTPAGIPKPQDAAVVPGSRDRLRELLIAMGFDLPGSGATPVSVILEKLDLIVRAIQPNEDELRYKLSYAAPVDITSKFPEDKPFRYRHADQELGLKRAASEDEIIWAFLLVSDLKLANNASDNEKARKELRAKLAELCQKPIDALLFLRPIYPNQRELRLELIDATDPRKKDKAETDPDSEKLEAKKWSYVYTTIQAFHEAMIKHFESGPATLGAGSSAGVDRDVIKTLLFRQLQPFGNPSSDQEVQLPHLVWRDLLLPRGTGLEAKFYELETSDDKPPPGDPLNSDLKGTRRDADLFYTDDGKHLGTNKEDGSPRGWKRNTPWPLLLPTDHVFDSRKPKSKGNPKPWRGRWVGRLLLPEAWRERKIWLAFNLDPLNDNGLRVSVRPAGSATWQLIDDWQKHPHDLEREPLATSQLGFYDIDVQFYDISKASDDYDAKFALCVAVRTDAAKPEKNAFQPIPGALFYFKDGDVVVGKSEFDKGYQRAWKAVYYAHALRLIADEINYFSKDPTRFQGIYPTYPAGQLPLGTQPFDLNDLYELPDDDRKRAFLDQWEHLRDYTSLRDLRGSARPARFAQFKAIFELSTQAGDADPAVAAPLISAALFDSTDLTDLVKECLSYWDRYSLPNAVLKNEIWLRRIKPFVHLLQHASVWMQAGSRFTGDLIRLAVADPLVPAAGNGLKALFLQGHPSGDSRHLDLVNGLRLRGRAALLAYLTVRGARWADGGPHTGGSVNAWSRMLLIDLECAPENRLARIQSAIVSCQRFVHERQMEKPAAADAWIDKWSGIASYAAWRATKDRSLYPENYIDKRHVFAKSAAFRLLESRLRRDQLSLLRPADDNPNPRSFDWLEEVERESGARLKQSLEGSPAARDPHAGWIAPLNSAFPEGWQPGPMDMNATVLLQGADRLSDFRFLLWPVTGESQEFDTPSKAESYKPPGENGEATLSLKSKRAVRVGWSYQICKPGRHVAEEWSQPFWTDELTTIPYGAADVTLAVFQMGDTLRVALDGMKGLDIPVGTALPHLPSSRKSPARVAPADHGSLFGYGGLLKLPVEYAGPVNPLPGYDIVPAVTDVVPVFGLSEDEKSHHGSYLIAAQLERRGRFAEAREWLTRAKALTSTFHWPDNKDPKGRAGILRHLRLLLAWADDYLARNTEESVRQAEGYYREAARLLGPRPRRSQCLVPADAGTIQSPAQSIVIPNLDQVHLNPALLGLWDALESGLANVHFRRHQWSQNRPSLRTSAHAFDLPHEAGAIAPQDWAGFRAHYRYAYLQQKALEFANELKAFSGALLAAFEKGDAEHLAALRAAQETQIGYAMLEVKQRQWAEAETQWRILQQNRFNTEFRKRFYEELVNGGLNGGEQSHLNLLEAAEGLTLVAQGFELAAQGVALIPNLTTGGAGISSPVVIAKVTGGEMISSMMNFAAKAFHTVAAQQQSQATRAVTGGGYDRRRREWEFQRDSAALEIRSLERQIDAAGQRLDIAKREVNIQHQQLANSRRNAEFLRTKFTAADLYDWMQQELLILHHQMYALALGLAKQAELAYRFERHYTPRRFVHEDQLWASYRFGLLAGEQLVLALRAMDKTHMDENVREHELTKVFSVRLHASEALATLRLTGQCEVEIPEWHFDLDHPGHYRRRIKNVAVTIPCATGPYQSVNATVTLLRDSVRLSPVLLPGYDESQSMEGDPRFVRRYASHQSIVTTSAQNDTGLFETNLRDERYLPFEGAGAISRWRIEIDPAANQFEPDSLTDIVINLRYTAVDGGVELRRSAQASAYAHLPSQDRLARKYLDLRQDYPSEWLNLGRDQTQKVGLYLSREMFPWSRNQAKLECPEVEILLRPEAGQSSPESLTVSVNGQDSQLLLIDSGFGDAYHGRVDLQPRLEIGPHSSGSLDLKITVPPGQDVPLWETAIVSAGYCYTLPKQVLKPCE